MTGDPLAQASGPNAPTIEEGGGVLHGSFAVPFDLSVPPGRVFAAFADLPLRRRWFRLPGEPGTAHHELDFRVGGGETAASTSAEAGVSERLEYRSHFFDIVPDERIVLTYEVVLDDRRRWVSLVTVELEPIPDGTHMRWTEQYVFFVVIGDGSRDVAHLQGSTRLQLNGLASVVEDRGSPSAVTS